MGSSGVETVQVAMDAGGHVDDVVKRKSAVNANGEVHEEAIRNETAAVEVQRVFRGHRARRNIADAATMAQKFGWWNVVEGAVLQHNSSNFYAYNTPQNAAQRWLRLKKKAAKVGKGLSKNEKARKLALQHWLEAIDPRHRYGHNLHFFYEAWGNSQTQEPFFYWLDIGEGKDIELEQCSRSKLQKDLIRYLSPKERKWFEVVVKDGKLYSRMTGEPTNTPKGDKWIFVMSTTGKLYVGKKEKGKLQHSSFLAGGATTAAGRLLVKDGTIQLMEAHSGHYHPTPENFDQLVSILTSSGADLTLAKVQVVSDDMLTIKSNSAKSMGFDPEITQLVIPVVPEDLENVHFNQGDGSIHELASLTLKDEQNASSVDKVFLLEKATGTQEKQGEKREVVIEGLELLQMGGSVDDNNLWDALEGMNVEIIKPSSKTRQSEGQTSSEQEATSSGSDATETSPSRAPSVATHKLYTPALQTISKADDRAGIFSADLLDVKTGKTVELDPAKKVYLLRRLSFNRDVVTPS